MNNQSNVIAAFLLVAFLVFITMRGELPTYIGLLLGEGSNSGGGVTASGNSPAASQGALLSNGETSQQSAQNIVSGFAALVKQYGSAIWAAGAGL